MTTQFSEWEIEKFDKTCFGNFNMFCIFRTIKTCLTVEKKNGINLIFCCLQLLSPHDTKIRLTGHARFKVF